MSLYGDNLFDSADFSAPVEDEKEMSVDEQVLDSASDDFGEKQERAAGMATALTWVEDEDYSFDALSAIVAGIVNDDDDDDGETTDDEEAEYNGLMAATAEALVSLGGKPANVSEFIDDENDEAGEKLGEYIQDKIDGVPSDDATLVSHFAVKKDIVFDAAIKTIRDGKVVLKKKRLKKKRMSPKQRMALKKAQKKANSSAAKRKRAKSMKIRKSRGM